MLNIIGRLDSATEETAWNLLASLGIPQISGGWKNSKTDVYYNDVGFATQIDDPNKIQELMFKCDQDSIAVIDKDGHFDTIDRMDRSDING